MITASEEADFMELRTFWKVFKRRWWIVAVPALAALAYAGYGYLTGPTQTGFVTSVRFTAAQPPDSEPGQSRDDRYYQWLTSEYVVNALTDWVTTNSFSQAVSDELNSQLIQIPASALQGVMVPDNARSVMVVNISWPDAGELAQIAAAVQVVLSNRSGEFFPALRDGGVSVIALDTPVISPVAPALTSRLNPILRFALGIAAGIGLAFLVEYLDPSVRDRADLDKLGMPILAEIPRQK